MDGWYVRGLEEVVSSEWWMVAKDKESSTKVLREAEAHIGL
jgi:hypothetical protein